MKDGRIEDAITIIPLNKPLQCWLVSDDSPAPDGPHEIHAMACGVSSVSTRVQAQRHPAGTFYDVPEEHVRWASYSIDPDGGIETLFFIPSCGSDCMWMPSKYVSFSEEGCKNVFAQLQLYK